MFDKLLDFVIHSVEFREKVKQEKIQRDRDEANDPSVPRPPGQFWARCTAGELIGPCRKKAEHHREREKHWIKALEEAEKELKEKGISMEVFDSQSQTYFNPANTLASGSIGHQGQSFQPRVDQKLLDNVKNAKAKMLEHRDKAVNYEELALGYSYNPDFTFSLSVKDLVFYGLGAK